jgi:hypothetical protein
MPPLIKPEDLQEVINPWLLGADPEFAVVEPPDKAVENAGHQSVQVATMVGSIGDDHAGRVWELRPAPSRCAWGVMENIWRLLCRQELDKVTKYKWKSGALGGKFVGAIQNEYYTGADGQIQYGVPPNSPPAPTRQDTLGGHVHFGIRALNHAQIAACHAVTTGMLNLDVLPVKENTVRQSLGSYGSMSHRATETTGDHIEYRVPPSWLDKPGQAFGVLTIYKLAAAQPSSVAWPSDRDLKLGLSEWIAFHARRDVDAFILDRFLEKRGFADIQADPGSDFKLQWRKEQLWTK